MNSKTVEGETLAGALDAMDTAAATNVPGIPVTSEGTGKGPDTGRRSGVPWRRPASLAELDAARAEAKEMAQRDCLLHGARMFASLSCSIGGMLLGWFAREQYGWPVGLACVAAGAGVAVLVCRHYHQWSRRAAARLLHGPLAGLFINRTHGEVAEMVRSTPLEAMLLDKLDEVVPRTDKATQWRLSPRAWAAVETLLAGEVPILGLDIEHLDRLASEDSKALCTWRQGWREAAVPALQPGGDGDDAWDWARFPGVGIVGGTAKAAVVGPENVNAPQHRSDPSAAPEPRTGLVKPTPPPTRLVREFP